MGLQYPFAHLAWFLLSSGKGKHNQFKFGFVVDKCTFRKQIWAVKVDIFKFEEDIKCEMVMLILMLMSMMATRLKANNLFSTENWKGYQKQSYVQRLVKFHFWQEKQYSVSKTSLLGHGKVSLCKNILGEKILHFPEKTLKSALSSQRPGKSRGQNFKLK